MCPKMNWVLSGVATYDEKDKKSFSAPQDHLKEQRNTGTPLPYTYGISLHRIQGMIAPEPLENFDKERLEFRKG
jgi:hypothetical protein